MAKESNAAVMIAVRISRGLHGELLRRQKSAEELTGIKPSVGAVVREIVERDLRKKSKRKTVPA